MSTEQDLSFGDFRLDLADERLWGKTGPIRLGNKAYRVLLMLARQEGRLLTKDALFTSVWDGTIVSESALTSVIKELRRALGDESRTPRYIESVYGRGYRFLPTVSRGGAPAPAPEEKEINSRPRARQPRIGEPPLLYLPAFDGRAVDDAHPYLAEALREEILFALSRFRNVRLVSDAGGEGARQGSAAFGERDYQLSVRLLPDGDSAKAFARLSRLSNHAIIWADNVALSAGNPGRDVERLVRHVVAAALPSLQDDVLARLSAEPDDVYDLYFHNKLKMRGADTLGEAKAVANGWERLIESHPGFGPAYPPLIRLYNTDYRYTGLGATGTQERGRARELARRALAIDPNEAYVHIVTGWCHLWAREAAAARYHFEEAIELNPWHQGRLLEAATGYMYVGDLDRAAELIGRGRDLTPFATDPALEDQGLLHLLRGDYEAASGQLALITNRTIQSEFFTMLAAVAARSGDATARAESWFHMVASRWAAPEPLTGERLTEWVLFHTPFQEEARRAWLAERVEEVLGLAPLLPAATERVAAASQP